MSFEIEEYGSLMGVPSTPPIRTRPRGEGSGDRPSAGKDRIQAALADSLRFQQTQSTGRGASTTPVRASSSIVPAHLLPNTPVVAGVSGRRQLRSVADRCAGREDTASQKRREREKASAAPRPLSAGLGVALEAGSNHDVAVSRIMDAVRYYHRRATAFRGGAADAAPARAESGGAATLAAKRARTPAGGSQGRAESREKEPAPKRVKDGDARPGRTTEGAARGAQAAQSTFTIDDVMRAVRYYHRRPCAFATLAGQPTTTPQALST